MTAARDENVKALAQAFGRDMGAASTRITSLDAHPSYAAARDAVKPANLRKVGAVVGGRLTEWVRDPAGTALGGGWSPADVTTPQHWGAVGDGVADDAPAFRNAVAFLAARGGGELHLGEKTYRFSSTETITAINIGATSYNPARPTPVFLALPYGVSMIGVAGKSAVKADVGGADAVIGLLDWGKAKVTGIEVSGPGGTGNAMHGVHFFVTSLEHENDDFELSDLNIHDVGSYGIGYGYGVPRRGLLRDIFVSDTGSDGVDWKVRSTSVPATKAEGVVFDNIEVRRFGRRIAGGSSTGFGIRGAVQANNIRVYELRAGEQGIVFSPGHSDSTIQHHAISPERSTLTNWYAEGSRDHRGADTPYGLVVWAAGAVQIGPGVARWCRVHTQPATVTPYPSLHGPRITATVIPVVNDANPVLLQIPGASVDVDVQSDYDLFSTKAGTAVAGQTVFETPTGHGQFVKVVLGQTTLTAGTDYTVSGNTVTLTTGLPAGEALFLVYPPLRAVRVEAEYQRISGHSDRWCPQGVSYASNAQVVTSSHIGFVADGAAGRLSPINSEAVTGLSAVGQGNVSLRLGVSGTGNVEVPRLRFINALPTSAAGLASGAVWNDAGTLRIV